MPRLAAALILAGVALAALRPRPADTARGPPDLADHSLMAAPYITPAELAAHWLLLQRQFWGGTEHRLGR